MGFPRQEYWSGLPFPSPGDLADPGIKPRSPALQVGDMGSRTATQRPEANMNLQGTEKRRGQECVLGQSSEWPSGHSRQCEFQKANQRHLVNNEAHLLMWVPVSLGTPGVHISAGQPRWASCPSVFTPDPQSRQRVSKAGLVTHHRGKMWRSWPHSAPPNESTLPKQPVQEATPAGPPNLVSSHPAPPAPDVPTALHGVLNTLSTREPTGPGTTCQVAPASAPPLGELPENGHCPIRLLSCFHVFIQQTFTENVLISHVHLFESPWTVLSQAPLTMGFPRQEYWSGLPFPSPGDLSLPGTEPELSALQADSLLSEPPSRIHPTNTKLLQNVRALCCVFSAPHPFLKK